MTVTGGPHERFLRRFEDRGSFYLGLYIGSWWAECACGWVGPVLATADAARAAHRDHLDQVRRAQLRGVVQP